MKVSIYTFVKDGLFYDFHVVAMLRHHLPLADEIIVNEGYSEDGTYEAISAIDPKIKVHRRHWDRSDPNGWHRAFKNQARELCTGDWCVLLDCDEFIPEWEFERLRAFLERTNKLIVPVEFRHFYGNYRVCLVRHRDITPVTGYRIHRNLPNVEVWGDGANVRLCDRPDDPTVFAQETFAVHHFGSVRHAARLRAPAQRRGAEVGQDTLISLRPVSPQMVRSRRARRHGGVRRSPYQGRSRRSRRVRSRRISAAGDDTERLGTFRLQVGNLIAHVEVTAGRSKGVKASLQKRANGRQIPGVDVSLDQRHPSFRHLLDGEEKQPGRQAQASILAADEEHIDLPSARSVSAPRERPVDPRRFKTEITRGCRVT
jgi:glycosyltransferase involved in cell wall biosynthesis